MTERPSLKPAYLISGSDRPKVETAVQRLRARFVPESVEIGSCWRFDKPEPAHAGQLGTLRRRFGHNKTLTHRESGLGQPD